MAISILIFDSGVGGLTIYDSVRKVLPEAHYTYVFDNAFFPYGELAEERLIERVLLVISKAVEQEKPDIIVIACNSASTLALPTLRSAFSIPIVGVVPAIKPAAALTKSGVIGLLATPGTVMRDYTQALIDDFAADKQVLSIGHSALVELAEAKMSGQEVDMQALKEVLASWLEGEIIPDTIVLGCTHFPLIQSEIALLMNDAVDFVDSGEAIGRRVHSLSIELGDKEKVQAKKSRAYCTRLDGRVRKLEINFKKYQFSEILCLSI